MSEEIDLNNVGETVMWLVRTVRDGSISGSLEPPKQYCRLNDFSEFEIYELCQARDSEDRF